MASGKKKVGWDMILSSGQNDWIVGIANNMDADPECQFAVILWRIYRPTLHQDIRHEEKRCHCEGEGKLTHLIKDYECM